MLREITSILALANLTYCHRLKAEKTSPTEAQIEAYSEFAESIEPWADEYGWEPHEVTTDDGYILTLFKMFRRDQDPEDVKSILF